MPPELIQILPAPAAGEAERQPETLLAEAEAAFAAREWLEAAKAYGAVARAADEAEPWFQYGVSLRLSGFLREAAAALGHAAALAPQATAPLLALGDVRMAQGDREAAIAHFRAALAIEPDEPGAAAGLEEALRLPAGPRTPPLPPLPPSQLKRVRRLMFSKGPDRQAAQAAVDRGDQLRDQARDWAGAAFAYAEGLSIDPTLTHIWVQLGHMLKESGDPNAAEAAYRIAIEQDPGAADTFLQLGHALKVQGRMADSAQAYLKALHIEGLARDSTRELAWLVRGEHDLSLEQLAEALDAGDGAPATVNLHVTRLVEALFSGQPTEADRAAMALVVEMVDSGGDIALCGGRRASSDLRRLPGGLLAEAFRAVLDGRRGEGAANDVETLLQLVADHGAPCAFSDGAVLVDFAGADPDGRFDQQLRALRREVQLNTLVYLPAAAAALANDEAAGRELFAALTQARGVLVDSAAEATAVLQWTAGRGLRLRPDALFVLAPEASGWGGRAGPMVDIARRFATGSEAPFRVRPGAYYALGLDPEADEPLAQALPRCGEGWWWPENWGCWTRPGGASVLLEPIAEPGPYELLIGLRSSLEGECRYVVSLEGLGFDGGLLPAARTEWRRIGVTLRQGPVRLKVVGVQTHRQGPGGEAASVGVIGFALRPRRSDGRGKALDRGQGS